MVIALGLGAHPAAAAMTAGAAVVLAGATRPRRALQQVDWSLLLFFGGLFVVMRGVEVGFFEYLRAGVPLTLLTLLLAWGGLALA
jgi:Na+/H+ antiporter NhaD/arsenite permease-like protein